VLLDSLWLEYQRVQRSRLGAIQHERSEYIQKVLLNLGYDPDTCHVEQLISWLELWDDLLSEQGELNALLESVREDPDVESLLPPLPQPGAENYQKVKLLRLLIKSLLMYKVNDWSENDSPAKYLLAHGKGTNKEMPKRAVTVIETFQRAVRGLCQGQQKYKTVRSVEVSYSTSILARIQQDIEKLESAGCKTSILLNKELRPLKRRPDIVIQAETPDGRVLFIDLEIDEKGHQDYTVQDEQIRATQIHLTAKDEYNATERFTVRVNVGNLDAANTEQVDVIVKILVHLLTRSEDSALNDSEFGELVHAGEGDHLIWIDTRKDSKHVVESLKRIHDEHRPKSIASGGADWEYTLYNSVITVFTDAFGKEVAKTSKPEKLKIKTYTVNEHYSSIEDDRKPEAK
jgi:hypothetical protein